MSRKIPSLLAIAGLLASAVSCGIFVKPAPSKNAWVFEGPACEPNSKMKQRGLTPAHYCKPEDRRGYLYMKLKSWPSPESIRRNDLRMKQMTCRESAHLQIAGDGLPKVVMDYVKRNPDVLPDCRGKELTNLPELYCVNRSIGYCCPMMGIGLYDCCSLNERTGRCAENGEAETWDQCLCIAIKYFWGGDIVQRLNKYCRAMPGGEVIE